MLLTLTLPQLQRLKSRVVTHFSSSFYSFLFCFCFFFFFFSFLFTNISFSGRAPGPKGKPMARKSVQSFPEPPWRLSLIRFVKSNHQKPIQFVANVRGRLPKLGVPALSQGRLQPLHAQVFRTSSRFESQIVYYFISFDLK